MNNITGKTVVITGAARGIGEATAAALLDRGARVIIGDRDPEELAKAVVRLKARGPASGHHVDVTDRTSFASFLDLARADGQGRIDILINNAGVMPIGAFIDQSQESIRSAIEVNFGGVIHGCQLILPEMVARRAGHIVNIASMAGLVAVPGQAVYAGSKFAVVGFSTALADEYAPRGVSVSMVLPTFTRTDLIAGTTPSAAQGLVTPTAVAGAVVKVLEKRLPQRSVPAHLRFLGPIIALLGTRVRRFINKVMGNDKTFLDFDATARRAYEDRVRASAPPSNDEH
ncbi:SDR family oxidoreductase [Mycolicibacterium sp. lyk4-40-TYG-92]|uniref:SDR family oxidoreductase n=1 Tax=Mycolicibacterium sp. lyk4-40-TYG-92 TaxID=3040295 RepID=UPI00254D0CD1|nr:SDR family oxidoreductase [Mycolicibacterium sp. lyk4-40-TYG-92]